MSETDFRVGPWRLLTSRPGNFGLVVHSVESSAIDRIPVDWVHDALLTPEHREEFFALVDRERLVLCKCPAAHHPGYRFVRGRSSRGRLSQGEYFHHDGCSGPTKPRVVEIRFPAQAVERHIATSIARFPENVVAMLRALPAAIADAAPFPEWHAKIQSGASLSRDEWDTLQGQLTRAIRRELPAEAARAYFRGVDASAGAFVNHWEWGDSCFIANENGTGTAQHRRAYQTPASDGRANGNLVKRWPAEELE